MDDIIYRNITTVFIRTFSEFISISVRSTIFDISFHNINLSQIFLAMPGCPRLNDASNAIYISGLILGSNQWETALLSNDVSHWLGASLESALYCVLFDRPCIIQWVWWLPGGRTFAIFQGTSSIVFHIEWRKSIAVMKVLVPMIVLFNQENNTGKKFPAKCDCRETFNINRTKSQNLEVSRLVCSSLFPIHLSHVLSREWRCSWSSTDRLPQLHVSDQQYSCLLMCH